MIDPNFEPSSAQWNVIFRRPKHDAPRSTTIAALDRRGFFYRDTDRWKTRRFTDAARAWVKARLEKRREKLVLAHPGLFMVHNDAQLLALMDRPSISLYMYRGGDGLVVESGDGQKPLAILEPFYQWEIETDKTAGRFLKYASIIGHKGSYGYDRKPDVS